MLYLLESELAALTSLRICILYYTLFNIIHKHKTINKSIFTIYIIRSIIV